MLAGLARRLGLLHQSLLVLSDFFFLIYEMGVTKLLCLILLEKDSVVRWAGWWSFLASFPKAVGVIFGRSLLLITQDIRLNTKVLSVLT